LDGVFLAIEKPTEENRNKREDEMSEVLQPKPMQAKQQEQERRRRSPVQSSIKVVLALLKRKNGLFSREAHGDKAFDLRVAHLNEGIFERGMRKKEKRTRSREMGWDGARQEDREKRER
jgi:hypothetical protein